MSMKITPVDFLKAVSEGDKVTIDNYFVLCKEKHIDPFIISAAQSNSNTIKEPFMYHLVKFISNKKFVRNSEKEKECIDYILYFKEKGFSLLHDKSLLSGAFIYSDLLYLLNSEIGITHNKAKKLILKTLESDTLFEKNDDILFATFQSAIRHYNKQHQPSVLPDLFKKLMIQNKFEQNFFLFNPYYHYHFKNKIDYTHFAGIYKKQIDNNALPKEATQTLYYILFDLIDNSLNTCPQKWFDFYIKSGIDFNIINEVITDKFFSFDNSDMDIDRFKHFLLNIHDFNDLIKDRNLKIDLSMHKRKGIDSSYIKIANLFNNVLLKEKAYSSKNTEPVFLDIFNSLNISFTKEDLFFAIFDPQISYSETNNQKTYKTFLTYDKFKFLTDNIAKFSHIKNNEIKHTDIISLAKFFEDQYNENSEMHVNLFNQYGLKNSGGVKESFDKICYLFSHVSDDDKIKSINSMDERYVHDFHFYLIQTMINNNFIPQNRLSEIKIKKFRGKEVFLIEAFDDYIKLNILKHNPAYFKSVYTDNYKEAIIDLILPNKYTAAMEYYHLNTIACLESLDINAFEKDKSGRTLFHTVVLFLHHNFNNMPVDNLQEIIRTLAQKWKNNVPQNFINFEFPTLPKNILPEMAIVYEKTALECSLVKKTTMETENNIKRKRI